MTYQQKCPVCGKRLFDIKDQMIGAIEIKCPHCRKTVMIEYRSEEAKLLSQLTRMLNRPEPGTEFKLV